MLRLIDSADDLRQMAAEGAGGLTFRFVVNGDIGELNRAAEQGDAIAGDLGVICARFLGFTAFAPPGAVRCTICDGPFALKTPGPWALLEEPWALVMVHASIPEPTLACCSAICSRCMVMDWGELQHKVMDVYRIAFPRLEVVHIAEPGHA